VFYILEREIINCLKDSTEEEGNTYMAKIKHMVQSGLHKVERSRLMPYIVKISWALDNFDI
jgi:hypothetical protein